MAGNHVQLSRRLKAIADMVTEGNRLVDVGCDHGYLPVYLMLNHKIPGAIATDVGKGPLARAQEHIAQYGMSKYIEARLCDGLQGVRTGEGDTLVIAGMGGPLMEKILTEGKAALPGFRELILQPQSDIPHFRHFPYGTWILYYSGRNDSGRWEILSDDESSFGQNTRRNLDERRGNVWKNCCWNVCIRFFISICNANCESEKKFPDN